MLGRELPSFTPEQAELRRSVDEMLRRNDALAHQLLGLIALNAVQASPENIAEAA